MKGVLSGSFRPSRDPGIAHAHSLGIDFCGGRWVFGGFAEGRFDMTRLTEAARLFEERLAATFGAMSEKSEVAAFKTAYEALDEHLADAASLNSVYFLIDKRGLNRAIHIAGTGVAQALVVGNGGLTNDLMRVSRGSCGTAKSPKLGLEIINDNDLALVVCSREVGNCVGRAEIGEVVAGADRTSHVATRIMECTSRSAVRNLQGEAIVIVANLHQ